MKEVQFNDVFKEKLIRFNTKLEFVDKIHDAFAEYRTINAEAPSHFILSMEARQAIKIMPFTNVTETTGELKEFLGIPVIPLEKVIIVD